MTKQVYARLDGSLSQYDIPYSADLTIQNDNDADLDLLVRKIVSEFNSTKIESKADRGKSQYWNLFYSQNPGVLEPSPFAMHVRHEIGETSGTTSLLEVGCGNGRDSVYFANEGFVVTAIDASEASIAQCQATHDSSIDFRHGKLAMPETSESGYDVIYSRFVLHAMTPDEETEFLLAAASRLNPGGFLFIECRSILDPMARKGEVLSPNERIHGHYRRFIVPEDLNTSVKKVGLDVISMVESNGLAVFGDEDPVVIRLTAKKTSI